MTTPVSKHITWHPPEVTTAPGRVLWFTGLSGSGKSSIARRVERLLAERGVRVYTLDGDNLRMGLNEDLGFDPASRRENVRRVGAVAALFAHAGLTCLAALISPYREDRERARARLPQGQFIEVFVDTPLAVCEARDPKGLYAKARANQLTQFTGISAPYEPPIHPEIHLTTQGRSLEACAQAVIDDLDNHKG